MSKALITPSPSCGTCERILTWRAQHPELEIPFPRKILVELIPKNGLKDRHPHLAGLLARGAR
jgi:hypothetical protein